MNKTEFNNVFMRIYDAADHMAGYINSVEDDAILIAFCELCDALNFMNDSIAERPHNGYFAADHAAALKILNIRNEG